MAKTRRAAADESCPQCGGSFELDARESDAAIEARFAPGGSAAAREAYVAKAHFKRAEAGTLLCCQDCGYQTRRPPRPQPARDEPFPAGV